MSTVHADAAPSPATPARQGHSNKTRFSRRLYDKKNFHLSLKQLRIFHAVHDYGGFTEAGEQLYLSQSTISYTIAKIQSQLGFDVFKLEGRKAILTEAGRIVLQRSRRVLKEALEFEAFAERLLKGQDGYCCLLVENTFPVVLLRRALQKFSCQQPDAALSIRLPGGCEATANALGHLPHALAICSEVPERLIGEKFLELEYVPVAHSAHPLSMQDTAPTLTDLYAYLQIVIEEPQALRQHAVPPAAWSENCRTVSNLHAALEAVHGAAGYAWLPRLLVTSACLENELSVLKLRESGTGTYTRQFYLVHDERADNAGVLIDLAQTLRREASRDACVSSVH